METITITPQLNPGTSTADGLYTNIHSMCLMQCCTDLVGGDIEIVGVLLSVVVWGEDKVVIVRCSVLLVLCWWLPGEQQGLSFSAPLPLKLPDTSIT